MYCPMNGKPCIDDMCRGSLECFKCREPMLEMCSGCGELCSWTGSGIECKCEWEPLEDDPLGDCYDYEQHRSPYDPK